MHQSRQARELSRRQHTPSHRHRMRVPPWQAIASNSSGNDGGSPLRSGAFCSTRRIARPRTARWHASRSISRPSRRAQAEHLMRQPTHTHTGLSPEATKHPHTVLVVLSPERQILWGCCAREACRGPQDSQKQPAEQLPGPPRCDSAASRDAGVTKPELSGRAVGHHGMPCSRGLAGGHHAVLHQAVGE